MASDNLYTTNTWKFHQAWVALCFCLLPGKFTSLFWYLFIIQSSLLTLRHCWNLVNLGRDTAWLQYTGFWLSENQCSAALAAELAVNTAADAERRDNCEKHQCTHWLPGTPTGQLQLSVLTVWHGPCWTGVPYGSVCTQTQTERTRMMDVNFDACHPQKVGVCITAKHLWLSQSCL